MKLNKTTNNKLRNSESVMPSVMDCVSREMSEKDGATYSRPASNHSKTSGGKNLAFVINDRPGRSPEDIAKRIAFFEARLAAKKDPANCPKCGKPRDRNGKMCARCIETQRRRVAKHRGIPPAGSTYSPAQLTRVVAQVRREMDRMQSRFKLWQKSADYRRNLHYRTNALRKRYHNPVSNDQALDYLSQTNHAYEQEAKK